MIETERRFLLKRLPDDLAKFPFQEVDDSMILTGEPHPHLRLRKTSNNGKTKFVLTKKYPKKEDDRLEMIEEEIGLNEIEFETLKKLPRTGQIKRRYAYLYKGLKAEIDIWLGKLKGLAVIEFEFETVDQANQFQMPDFCLQEVTQLEWLAGGKLSGKSYADIKADLEKAGYRPIFL